MKSTIDKKELIEWIERLDNEALLVTLQSMKDRSTGEDFWDDLPEEVKQAIDKGKKQLEEGKGIPHEQVMKEINERLSQ
jgi:predicted transcriptional regulator